MAVAKRGRTPTDRMLEVEGVALANPADASEVFSSLWKTQAAAKSAFQRAPRFVGETGGRFIVVEYQRKGAGRRVSEALFNLNRTPDPEGWLIAKFGSLVDFGVTDERQERDG